MRISDWSSDVCSSDLAGQLRQGSQARSAAPGRPRPPDPLGAAKWSARSRAAHGDVGSSIRRPAHRCSGTGPPTHHAGRSEEHTSELQSLMRISYAVFCLNKKKTTQTNTIPSTSTYIAHEIEKKT